MKTANQTRKDLPRRDAEASPGWMEIPKQVRR
jgi:hypothetical protein